MRGRKLAVPESLSQRWLAYRDARLQEQPGLSLWRIASEIYGKHKDRPDYCPPSYGKALNTIYAHVSPFFQNQQALNKRLSDRRNSERRRAERRQRSRRKERRREYRRALATIYRPTGLQKLLRRFLVEDTESMFRTDDFAEFVRERTNQPPSALRDSTVNNALRRYSNAQRQGDVRGPKLEELEDGKLWRYSSPRPESYPDQSEPNANDGNDTLKVFLGKVAGLLIGIAGLMWVR